MLAPATMQLSHESNESNSGPNTMAWTADTQIHQTLGWESWLHRTVPKSTLLPNALAAIPWNNSLLIFAVELDHLQALNMTT